MKPFDIELAKQGKPVCLRNGRKARIVCFDAKNGDYPIIALVEDGANEVALYYNVKGRTSFLSDHDLMMASKKKTGWINIYPKMNSEDIGKAQTGERVYNSERAAKLYALSDCIATVPIEWEE